MEHEDGAVGTPKDETPEEMAARVAAAAAPKDDPPQVDEDLPGVDDELEGDDDEDFESIMSEAPGEGSERVEIGGEERRPAEETAAPPATAVEPTPERKATSYRVLESVLVKSGDEQAELWREIGVYDGPRALDLARAELGREPRSLVAVPNRSWRPKRWKPKPEPTPKGSWE